MILRGASKLALTCRPSSDRHKPTGLEPHQYLREVFMTLPEAEAVESIENLLPWAVKKIPAETR